MPQLVNSGSGAEYEAVKLPGQLQLRAARLVY